MKTKQQNTRIVTMALGVSYGDNPTPVEDTMKIYVYDDACKAAIAAGLAATGSGNVDGDCDTDIDDLAELIVGWLVDTTITEPVKGF